MDKPIVYLRRISREPVIGCVAIIQCIDHPSALVTNWPQGGGYVMTSPVVNITDDGFETMNTIYKKHLELFSGEA